MTMLSKPSKEKTRALRAAVASYMDHIGLHDRAEFMRAQPDDFTAWSDYAHQLVTVMDKKTFQKDLPPNIEGMMDFSKDRTAALTARNRGLERTAEVGRAKASKGLRQSENVIDRQDKGRLPVEPSLLAQALAEAQDIGERGQRGFGKLIAALMGESEQAAPQPRSKEDLARNIRSAYGAEAWGVPSPMTIDKHAWDAAGNPSFGGPWVKDLEQKMAAAWAEANQKDQSTVGGDTGGFDPAHFPGGYPPFSDNPDDFDGDGQGDLPDLLKGGATFAAGGRNSRMLNKKGLWGKETKQLGVPTTPGAAVTAPVGGKVVYADEFQSYGYTVIVRGEDGTHYDINGMQAGLVQPGDQVTAGQPIGVAGEQTNIGIKGANGKWGDPTSLAEGLQSAGTDPVPGYDGAEMAGDPVSPNSGLVGPSTSSNYADAGLRGAPMMPGAAPSADYADAGVRGGVPNPSAVAKALSVPDNDLRFSLPGLETTLGEDDVTMVDLVAPPTAPPAPNYGMDEAAKDVWGGIQSLIGPAAPDQPAFERGMPAAEPLNGFDKAYDAANKGLTDAWGGLQGLFGGSPTDEGAPAFERGFNGIPSTTAPSSTPDPAMGRHALDRLDRTRNTIEASIAARNAAPAPSNISMTAIKGVEGLLGAPASTSVNSAASKALAAALSSQPQALGPPMSDPRAAMHRDGLIDGDMVGDIEGDPNVNSGLKSDMYGSIADISPSFASAMGSPFGGFAPGPAAMSAAQNFGAEFGAFGNSVDTEGSPDINRSNKTDYGNFGDGEPMGEAMGIGSFGGIGTPDNNQEASFERGYQQGMAKALGAPSLSMAAMSGTPALAIDATRGFANAFGKSVKSLGPKYSKALAAFEADPTNAQKQANVANTASLYGKMNGQPSKAVRSLREKQIAEMLGMAQSPVLSGLLGYAHGQPSEGALDGGLGGDPFGGFGGPMGPGFGSGGGFGGGPGQPSGPSFSGPSGPSAGAGGGYGGGTSGGQPSGPSFGGPSGPAAGPGGGYGGGNPGGSPSPGGVTTGRGPSSNPGSGGGLSAAARSAIGAALSHEAAAAAASDAARGFGGGYGGFGPSFSGGFF